MTSSSTNIVENIIFGRSLSPEYVEMFGVEFGSLDPSTAILDVASGVSSFVIEIRNLGFSNVHAVDPLYRDDTNSIRQRAEESLVRWMDSFENPDESFDQRSSVEEPFAYDLPFAGFRTPAEMARHRRETLEFFLADFDRPESHQRYLDQALPALKDLPGTYQLILCGNLLFAHSQFDVDFITESIRAMIRVLAEGGEIRIFPVGSAFEEKASSVIDALAPDKLLIESHTSHYRLGKGWDSFLLIRRHNPNNESKAKSDSMPTKPKNQSADTNQAYVFEEKEWTQRSYHGDKIYGNLDRFIKISLAIAGGLAYLAVNEPDGNKAFIATIVQAASTIWLCSGVLCVANIVCHFTFIRYQLTPSADRHRLKLLRTAEFWMILFIIISSLGGFFGGLFIANQYIDNDVLNDHATTSTVVTECGDAVFGPPADCESSHSRATQSSATIE